MKIISFFAKLWCFGLGIFLFISYIMPRERPFANGTIYVEIEKTNNKGEKANNSQLYYKSINDAIKSLTQIDQWMKKYKINKVVFHILQYDAIIFYLHLKQQKLLDNNRFFIATIPESLNIKIIKKILLVYHQTIGALFEYGIGYLSSCFKSSNKVN